MPVVGVSVDGTQCRGGRPDVERRARRGKTITRSEGNVGAECRAMGEEQAEYPGIGESERRDGV